LPLSGAYRRPLSACSVWRTARGYASYPARIWYRFSAKWAGARSASKPTGGSSKRLQARGSQFFFQRAAAALFAIIVLFRGESAALSAGEFAERDRRRILVCLILRA